MLAGVDPCKLTFKHMYKRLKAVQCQISLLSFSQKRVMFTWPWRKAVTTEYIGLPLHWALAPSLLSEHSLQQKHLKQIKNIKFIYLLWMRSKVY